MSAGVAGVAAVPDDVARRAVEWLIELQSAPLSAAVRREWEQWRGSHPDHERAWQRIEAVNGRLQTLGGPQHQAVATALLTRRGSGQRRHAVKTLALLFFTGGAAWLAEENTPWREWSADQRSAIGDTQRLLALEDGSRVAMNSGSALNVSYDGDRRRLHLLSGEILVTAADATSHRPLVVQTAQGLLQALDSRRFAVRLYPSTTSVSVFDGAVELRLRQGATTRTLYAGQQAWFGSEAVTPPESVDDDSVAWTDGLLIARALRLAAFLDELNRYSTVALSCAGDVAELRVSGSYRLNDVQLVLETVAAALSLEIETTSRFFGRYRTGVRLARA